MNDRRHITTIQAQAPKHADPAASNVNWEWLDEVLRPLGLTVLAVELYSQDTEAWAWPNESLGPKLDAAHLGSFDSYATGNPLRFFFYVRSDSIAQALQLVFDEIARAGIKQRCKVGYADIEAKLWRTARQYKPMRAFHRFPDSATARRFAEHVAKITGLRARACDKRESFDTFEMPFELILPVVLVEGTNYETDLRLVGEVRDFGGEMAGS